MQNAIYRNKTSQKLNSTLLACVLICSCAFSTAQAQTQPKDSLTAGTTQKIERNPFIAPQNPETYTQNDITLIPEQQNSTKSKKDILVVKLNYARAQDVSKSLQNIFGGDKLAVDAITNAIIFKGNQPEGQRLLQAVRTLDIATKQVTLEAKVIALNKEDSKNLGVSWNWDKIPQNEDYQNNNDYDSEDTNNYGGNFKFWRGYSFKFNATLNALFAKGKAKLLATPSIITIPGREASIFIGDHIPVQTEKHNSTGSYTTTEYLDAGIKLTYTPIVSSDGKMVTATVHTEVSTPTLVSEMKNYRITSRTADTNVRMLNGETLIIGGLLSEEEQRSIQKVPLLSNIPIFGELFKNRSKRKAKTEVIMLLTPHITEAGKSPAIYSHSLKD
ncbi:MAG: type II and III secretion system protein [Phascolarctobacterium sp.]|nr:type II and III secretion system protein [Phascolarctobacterium sp.]